MLQKLSPGRAHSRLAPERFQYSEQFKETAAFRIAFGGEEPSQVVADLDIHNSYTLRNWVSLYQRKVQTGLFVSSVMKRTQKRNIQALQHRNVELEQTVQQANLLILALYIMMEVVEQELQLPIRKKSGTKRS